jgi:AbrB family looped-hinge helix DNA binding protein
MAASRGPTTTVSTKGQVILPKSIRQRRQWGPGTHLTVEETADGVLLRRAAIFSPARPEEVFGCLAYSGPAKTIEEMDAAIAAEARRSLSGALN